jgi:hypothetical protein
MVNSYSLMSDNERVEAQFLDQETVDRADTDLL